MPQKFITVVIVAVAGALIFGPVGAILLAIFLFGVYSMFYSSNKDNNKNQGE